MNRRQMTALLLALFLLIPAFGQAAVANEAKTMNEANRQLLQKGLTLHEIDQELSRITLQETKLTQRLADTEKLMVEREQAAAHTRQHAAKVVRAYYMGDRDSLWILLFSINSLSDALSTLEYLHMILQSDRAAIQKHTKANEELKQLKDELSSAQAELRLTKERFLTERQRQVTLKNELDKAIASNKDAELLLRQILDLNRTWQEQGIPLFRTYFKALAEAMKQLPELAGGRAGGNTNLIMNGFNYTFQITDTELNDFLRSKNALFQNLQFQFTPEHVLAVGKQDNMDISIKGSYHLQEKASDGKKFVKFRIDELHFNGYKLPDTTVADLEKDFDLGIYPQNLAVFLQVSGIQMTQGKLSLYLKLAL